LAHFQSEEELPNEIENKPSGGFEFSPQITVVITFISVGSLALALTLFAILKRKKEGVNALFDLMSREKQMGIWILSPKAIEKTFNYANSVRFDFTKKGLKINIPK
jgi:hypothetical protein